MPVAEEYNFAVAIYYLTQSFATSLGAFLYCVAFILNHFEPFRSRCLRYKKNNTPYLTLQPPFLGNSLITKLSTDSSPKSGIAMLTDSAITLPMNYKRAVLLNVDHVHLYASFILGHNLERLLPISRSTGVMSLL